MAENTEIIPQVDVNAISNVSNDYIMTMNTATVDGKITILNALNDAVSLKDTKDKVIKVVDCITMPGIRKGRNGMSDMPCVNTYLVDDKGTAHFTQSDGIARSVKQIAMLFPTFRLDEKRQFIPIRVVERELQNGNTIKNLVVEA